jgi:HlyD family secretion protein
MLRRPRRLVVAATLLAAIALVVVVLRPAPLALVVAPVVRGPLAVTVDEEGETRVRDRFVVAAPVSGRLDRIRLDEGDRVAAGDVLAKMNPLPLDPRTQAEAAARLEAAEAAKREADARVEQARAALEQAEREAKRARHLARAGTISKEEREHAELEEVTRGKELEAALFAARAADYNVQAARAALLAPGTAARAVTCDDGAEGCLEIRAPVNGRVLRVLEESERVVNVGAPLLEIGDPRALEIVVDVLSTDAVKVRPGAPVFVEEWGGEHPLRAHVRLVEPSGFTKVSALGVEEQRVNVIADFDDDPGALGDGYRLEARIVVWQSDDVLKTPASSLFRHGSDWNVFAVEDGRARRRTVEVGHGNAFEFEVKGGLDVGDRVILHPSDLVYDGVRVKAEEGAR